LGRRWQLRSDARCISRPDLHDATSQVLLRTPRQARKPRQRWGQGNAVASRRHRARRQFLCYGVQHGCKGCRGTDGCTHTGRSPSCTIRIQRSMGSAARRAQQRLLPAAGRQEIQSGTSRWNSPVARRQPTFSSSRRTSGRTFSTTTRLPHVQRRLRPHCRHRSPTPHGSRPGKDHMHNGCDVSSSKQACKRRAGRNCFAASCRVCKQQYALAARLRRRR